MHIARWWNQSYEELTRLRTLREWRWLAEEMDANLKVAEDRRKKMEAEVEAARRAVGR